LISASAVNLTVVGHVALLEIVPETSISVGIGAVPLSSSPHPDQIIAKKARNKMNREVVMANSPNQKRRTTETLVSIDSLSRQNHPDEDEAKNTIDLAGVG
jgi:hypothetical protein